MKYKEIFEQIINEINMSPAGLRSLVADINAQAGMEFEMIVPGAAESASGDDYLEPDYDSNESTRSFRQIRDFFHDGDYNGRRDVERLEQRLLDDYMDSDFLSEKKQEAWGEASYDAVRDLVDRDYADDLRDQATDEISAKTPEFGVNGDEFQEAVLERYNELVQEKIDDILANMGSEYDEAYEEWEQNEWQDIWNDFDLQEEWLEHEGLETMSDVADNYDITWPYYYNPNDGGGEVSVDDAADSFSRAMGKPVNASSSYHGARREAGHYVVEPDGSLEADDDADGGLEFVSPPMPINELLDDLKKVKAWADKTGCYTNDSTGLHINVSVPGWQGDVAKLDYVKLAILLGDEYILNEFGRQGNTYCKSALKIVKDNITQRPEDVKLLLDKMREHLNTSASKLIHSGATSKYTSINTKTGYIEFRSPGGDWLNENFDKIENTLYRFVVAMDAAVDETKYKQEYAKKLYKLLSGNEKDNTNTLTYFAQYAAGELPQSALKSFIKQAQLERKVKKDPTSGQKYWWSVGLRSNSNYRIEVVGSSKEEAISAAMDSNTDLMRYNANTDFTARPIRPFDDSPVRATVGEPQPVGQQNPAMGLWDFSQGGFINTRGQVGQGGQLLGGADFEGALDAARRNGIASRIGQGEVDIRPIPQASSGYRNALSQTDIENRLGWGGQAADANYEVVDRSNNQSVFKFIANTPQEAQRKYGQVLDVFGFPHDTENYGYREIPVQGSTQDLQQQRAQGGFTGQWKVVDNNGQELYRFGGVGNSQADANRIAQQWVNTQRAQGHEIDARELDVLPIMG